jgi:putative endonuclease
MKTKQQSIGRYGEELAKNYLLKYGYTILDSNLKLSFYELDIITKKKGLYTFVEVKTQLTTNQNEKISPELALDQKQINNLKKGIILYCRKYRIPLHLSRLDCIAVALNKPLKSARIKHYKDILY